MKHEFEVAYHQKCWQEVSDQLDDVEIMPEMGSSPSNIVRYYKNPKSIE
jgi:hypothetical protein